MILDLKTLRELKRQLSTASVLPKDGQYFVAALPQLTEDGVVMVGLCMMHPNTFKDLFGLAAWEELLKRPRIPNPYGDDLDS